MNEDMYSMDILCAKTMKMIVKTPCSWVPKLRFIET